MKVDYYHQFIETKSERLPSIGMTDIPPLCPAMKPFQRAITEWALRRGRAALFEQTGLGKTLQSLSWARAVADHEQGKVIIFTPLAVAEQTCEEAAKFGIDGVAYAADQSKINSDIVVTNYERAEKFNIDSFCGVNLDECFAAGTLVDVVSNSENIALRIEDVKPGMHIKNASGIDRVVATAKREVFGAVKVKVGSANYICSTNHLFFTELGWMPACHLQAGDRLVVTDTAMCLVRNSFSAKAGRAVASTSLRGILLSEMASYWGGRSQSSRPSQQGLQEGREICFSRVESVEILELGDSRLDCFREADGKLYFYDIEAERHPSFSVGGHLVHNSGILKSKDGATRAMLTDACRNLRWRLCNTATPAPNDYTELGQHAEFLGIMTAKEMLSMYFVHDGSIRANDDTSGSDGWRLKRHATDAFWRWLASWSVMIRHPRDIGFDNPEYDLPPAVMKEVIVPAEYEPIAGQLFPFMASTMRERIAVRRDTARNRVLAAASIVAMEPDQPWLIWCNLNTEADLANAMIPRSLQVAGRDPIEQKIARLFGFKHGKPLILVSKPSIAGHGMNWQNCSRMIFVGLTDSFEAVYQAIRRCWRFGQTRSVEVYFVVSELEGNVLANIRRKEAAYNQMQDAMAEHMRDSMQEELFGKKDRRSVYEPKQRMECPEWL